MKKIDGYAIVITDFSGKIIDVHDLYWSHPQLHRNIGDDEIKDAIYELEAKDAKVFLPLTYQAYAGGWVGGDWSDPEENISYTEEYIVDLDYKQKFYNEIQEAWKDEFNWRYVDDMIKNYKELYSETVELNQIERS